MQTLDEYKLTRFRDLELHTQEILARGYTYSGTTVSLSLASQVKYQTLSTIGLLSAPVSVESADPLQAPLVLPSLLNPAAFLSSVNSYLRSVYEAETVLKSAIRAANTVSDAELILDTRP